MAKRVKTNYDRGYVNAMDKIRVFIESSSKVMYVDTREYKNAETARCAYRNAIALVRAMPCTPFLATRRPALS